MTLETTPMITIKPQSIPNNLKMLQARFFALSAEDTERRRRWKCYLVFCLFTIIWTRTVGNNEKQFSSRAKSLLHVTN